MIVISRHSLAATFLRKLKAKELTTNDLLKLLGEVFNLHFSIATLLCKLKIEKLKIKDLTISVL